MKGVKPLLLLLALSVIYSESKAQTFEILGGNMLNGAVTGTILGAATMGLQNSNDFTPLRIGVGVGTIIGTGIAIYDVSSLPQGEQLFISGVFNDGMNSSIIILLDTFYGAAGGAILASAGTLIANRPVVEGLQYGSSIGAWVGFGFGLIDAFSFARRNRDFIGAGLLERSSLLQANYDKVSIGFGTPSIVSISDYSEGSIKTRLRPVLGVVSLKVGI